MCTELPFLAVHPYSFGQSWIDKNNASGIIPTSGQHALGIKNGSDSQGISLTFGQVHKLHRIHELEHRYPRDGASGLPMPDLVHLEKTLQETLLLVGSAIRVQPHVRHRETVGWKLR